MKNLDQTDKTKKAKQKMAEVKAAANRIAIALAEGQPVSLDDAKVLEAAGCWVRRQIVSR